jgi:glutaredoxin
MPVILRLYSRPDCHLCVEMEALVVRLAREFGAGLEKINIETDPGLEAEFGQEIPVLFINGRKAFKYRVSEHELRKRLQGC